MRDQKGGAAKKASPRSGQQNSSARGAIGSSTASSQILRGMKFMVKKLASRGKAPLAPQAASEKAATNLTTFIGSPARGNRDITLTARSGHFSNGSVSLGKRRDLVGGLAGDNLAKEFAMLRGDNIEAENDMLNNTVDVVDFKY